ncbi:hypothetical protein FHS79_003444 [Polymorphobacter multimanifer]|uniref:DUF4331 domain-containing protein n=1 Tax=Polymorphobacter multimanifer TaxID=1070431 RepID=A0A841LDY9_9SPHN|nr:DUF4331 domain-containing protein [Polymorphobacter multimanifer]MBB6229243.1 hypothetical protein [Polymorphobacter multimanifer]
MCYKTFVLLGTALTSATLLGFSPVSASSHREAPGITKMPKVDNTDTYAFRSYEPGRADFVTLIANFQPLQSPGGGPNYFTMDPDALYEIHIDNNGDAVEDLTYQFKFSNTLVNDRGITLNIGGRDLPIALRAIGPVSSATDPDLGERETYTLTQITGDRRTGARAPVANASGGGTTFAKPLDNVGNKTLADYPAYAKQFIFPITIPACSVPGKVFAGQRAEYFAVNLGPIFDLVNFVPIQGAGETLPQYQTASPFPGGITQSQDNQELIGKKNVTTLAIEVPIACLRGTGNGTIGVWSTASLPQARLLRPNPTFASTALQGGAFVQVSRLGMPLVNEVVIGLPQKDLFNAAEPTQDSALAEYVTNPTFPAILNALFRGPVNQTLGTNFADLAPSNFPREDLVATFLTGITSLNRMTTVTPSEMLRLNTGIAPTPQATQHTLGVAGDDLAGFPNGRRPGDDVVDIVLRVAMGRLCHPVPIAGTPTNLGLCSPAQAPTGLVAFTDGAPSRATNILNEFPYLTPPLRGAPRPQTQP